MRSERAICIMGSIREAQWPGHPSVEKYAREMRRCVAPEPLEVFLEQVCANGA